MHSFLLEMPSRITPPLAAEELASKHGTALRYEPVPAKDALLKQDPRTIDELMRQRRAETPQHPIFAYPTNGVDYEDYTYQQLDDFAHEVAARYVSRIPQRTSSEEPEIVVGLLGPSNLDYLITLLALTKLGHTVLFLSTRISEAAYVSLLQRTSAQHLVINTSFQRMARKIQSSLPDLHLHEILGQPTYMPSKPGARDTGLDHHYELDVESGKTAWIIHSSGCVTFLDIVPSLA